ncbi:hypothetical protein PAXRUDRAFT_824036 [Paxillus rubicundulus Ve08.2h10]|uniref:Uncharacterized protein n=1 Tax=Paxillus rubicundulus Ve08.2h10 TaxID=930991 RepID=A0A0D0E887_9AGAM|nr:hypothetical protein PAXRUDRAFT_824036 [Paxillus rubicundulus Ve08.2h10]
MRVTSPPSGACALLWQSRGDGYSYTRQGFFLISESARGPSNVWSSPRTIDIVRGNAFAPICHSPGSSPQFPSIPANKLMHHEPTPDFSSHVYPTERPFLLASFSRSISISSRGGNYTGLLTMRAALRLRKQGSCRPSSAVHLME